MKIGNTLSTLIIGGLSVSLTATTFGQNLFVNGDFETGNTGFTSDYRFAKLDSGLLTYDIFSNPSRSHFLGVSFGDHTSGTGLMFGANGGNDTNRVLWRQIVNVVTNTAYRFSGWATPCVGPSDPDPSRIRISINGSAVGPSVHLSNPPGNWQYFSAVWNSGAFSVATIELRLETIEQGGNDPALDDLRFELAGHDTSGFAGNVAAAPAGLIGWWPGDGSAKDLTGRFDGVPTSIGFAAGKVGPAFRFVGTNSFVRIPNQPAFSAITNVTLECWVWNDPLRPFRRLLTLTPDWVRLALDESGRPMFAVAGVVGGQVINARGDNPVTGNAWHHIVGTFDGQSVRLYLDGTLVAVQNAPSNTANNGAAPEVYISFLQAGEVAGFIDEAAVYSRALTPAEVASHFTAGSAGMAKIPIISSIGLSFPGSARLTIKGHAGKAVTIQSSTNLLDWATLTTDPNPKGTVNFTDTLAAAFKYRFYRVVGK